MFSQEDSSHPHACRKQSRSGSASSRFIPTHVGNSVSLTLTGTAGTVHPHARGEQTLFAMLFTSTNGSSPRTWGTGQGASTPATTRRFIPTHVGNRSSTPASRSRSAVHPHARGEQEDREGDLRTFLGSSPRTWGTVLHGSEVWCGSRFIPTHVGNSTISPSKVGPPTVHPHARGEQWEKHSVCMKNVGSSPRTWGTGPKSSVIGMSRRFIPTHVGNSLGDRSHLCKCLGSSPRTWGTD